MGIFVTGYCRREFDLAVETAMRRGEIPSHQGRGLSLVADNYGKIQESLFYQRYPECRFMPAG